MKLDEFVLRKASRDVREFADQTTLILNNGKYSAQVVGTPPTWFARNGEFLFMTSSTTRRIYFYVNNAWNYLEFVLSTSGGGTGVGGSPGGSDTHVQFNSSNVFGGNSGFTYIAHSAAGIAENVFFAYNVNTGSSTYTLYSTSDSYLSTYVLGQVRLQM